MRISVVGTGYVGLVSGTCLAESGITATCVDIDADKIERLKQGIIPIYEPGLSELVVENLAKDRLRFTTNIKESLEDCDALFIAVGTPPDDSFLVELVREFQASPQLARRLKQWEDKLAEKERQRALRDAMGELRR